MKLPPLPPICSNVNFKKLNCRLALAVAFIIVISQVVLTFHRLFSERLRSFRPQFTSGAQLPVNSILNFHQYGKDNCFSPLEQADIMEKSAKMSKSCRHHHPAQQASKSYRVGTLTAIFGGFHDEAYNHALHTHQIHSVVQADSLHVLCSPITDGMWNKQQFVLHIMYEEMTKPEGERLEWLLWADGDTMILDQCRHLSDFLPPKKDDAGRTGTKSAAEVQLIAAKDWNGLNAGVFFIRVSQWSIDLLNAVNAFRVYNPEAKLDFEEQSAMAQLFERDQFKKNVTFVPQHWFNAYAHTDRSYAADLNLNDLESHQARRGDFMVHFPGNPSRHKLMLQWSSWLEAEGNVWESGRVERNVFPEIDGFWKKELRE